MILLIFLSSLEHDDYQKSRFKFRFSAPLPAQSIMCDYIIIENDDVVEPCEDFLVSISSPSKRAVIDGDSRSIVQINDDEGNYCFLVAIILIRPHCLIRSHGCTCIISQDRCNKFLPRKDINSLL